MRATKILMDINAFFTQVLYYFEMQLHILFIKHFYEMFEYIRFFNFGLK